MSAENRQQAVAALTVVIHQWWSDNRDRSAGADGGAHRRGGASVAERRICQGMWRRTTDSVTIGP